VGFNSNAKKYITMPMTRALTISYALLISLASIPPLYAEDLKEIAAQSSQGQHSAAMERINNHIKAHPNDVQALFMRAVMLAEQNRKDDAIRAFTEITEKFPALPEPYNNLAVLFADQGQFDKAKKSLENAIKTHPSYATAHENLGDIYAKMATEAYGKALQLDNTNASAQNKLALIKDLFSATNKPLQMASAKPTTTPAVNPPPTNNVTKPEPVATNKAPEISEAATENKRIADSVNQWAKAWSSKDIDGYLSSYAQSFKTPDGLSREAWEEMRKSRINKPEKISVSINNLSVEIIDGTHARAKFKQDYRAGSLIAKTPKTLDLVKSGQRWLIEQERTGR
jgi:tetratricopeptide (TPR) repeat protein